MPLAKVLEQAFLKQSLVGVTHVGVNHLTSEFVAKTCVFGVSLDSLEYFLFSLRCCSFQKSRVMPVSFPSEYPCPWWERTKAKLQPNVQIIIECSTTFEICFSRQCFHFPRPSRDMAECHKRPGYQTCYKARGAKSFHVWLF